MSQLGPAFLHQPITGLSLPDWRKALDWQLEGLRLWAPRRLRKYGFAEKESIVEFENSTKTNTLGTVEKSLLGEQRLVRKKTSVDDLPIALMLHDSLVFEATIDLPAAARASLADAVAMRLDEVSPIPLEDVALAIGAVKKTSPGRIQVEIAITKKSTINEAVAALSGKRVKAVGAAADATGKAKYSFKTFSEPTDRKLRQWAITAAALWASFVLLGAALDHRTSERIAALENYETDLINEARRLRADADKYAALALVAPPLRSARDVQDAISKAATDLPDGSIISEISFVSDMLLVSGLTPTVSTSDGATPPFRRDPSEYAGYDKFQFTRPLSPVTEERN